MTDFSDDVPTRTDQLRPHVSSIFVVEAQDERGVQRCVVTDKGVTLGSGARADLRIEDALVSRVHAELRVHEGRLQLTDLDSKNGSFLGGARVREARLCVGSVVVLGETSVTIHAYDLGEIEPYVDALPGLAGRSVLMRRIASEVRELATLSAAVLIRGETGTGKELVARALHDLGPRARAPFVPLNVANLPHHLVESELFGHERGAFTGAIHRRSGAFADAAGGTLFLDEIGELPADAQPKLLRVLDGYEVRRVGAQGGGVTYDARVVAATHVALDEHVTAGHFRRDLFHRLEVCVIELPALRQRTEDIPAMAKVMLRRLEPDLGPRRVSSAALARLLCHDWPGNARELRNVLYRAALAAKDEVIDARHVQQALSTAPRAPARLTPKLAKAILRDHEGNLSAAARTVGVPRTTFRKVVSS